MRSSLSLAASLASLLIASTHACLHFNATLDGNKLTATSYDDGENDGKGPEDLVCQGQQLIAVSPQHWSVPCPMDDRHASVDVLLASDDGDTVQVVYRYYNPDVDGDGDLVFTFYASREEDEDDGVDGVKFAAKLACP